MFKKFVTWRNTGIFAVVIAVAIAVGSQSPVYGFVQGVAKIVGGTIDNVVIGSTTPTTASFASATSTTPVTIAFNYATQPYAIDIPASGNPIIHTNNGLNIASYVVQATSPFTADSLGFNAGNPFTLSATVCTVGAVGANANPMGGKFTMTTGGSNCVVTITYGRIGWNNNGWLCSMSDWTQATNIAQTGETVTTATFKGTFVSGDTVGFFCLSH